MKATVAEAKTFKAILDAIAEMVEETSFKATPEGIRLRNMDTSRSAMITVDLPKEFFESYEVEEEEIIGLQLTDLRKLLQRAGASKLHLDTTKKDGRMQVKLEATGRGTRSFGVPLIRVVGEDLPDPKVPFKAKVKLIASLLDDAIKDCAIVGDTVAFTANKEDFNVTANGDDGEIKVEFSEATNSLLSIELKDGMSQRTTYTISFLQSMMKAADASDIVELQYGQALPVRMDFDLPTKGSISYFLAPRIEGS